MALPLKNYKNSQLMNYYHYYLLVNDEPSKEDLPHFAEVLQIRFPFLHTELWADSNVGQLYSYVENYMSMAALLQQAELAEIRNGIDHMRDEERFPKPEKMLACVSRLREAYTYCIDKRYLPEIHWLESTEIGSPGIDTMNNNSSGFSGLPNGYRDYDGWSTYRNWYAFWWTATEVDSSSAKINTFSYYSLELQTNSFNKMYGISVRLVRDK